MFNFQEEWCLFEQLTRLFMRCRVFYLTYSPKIRIVLISALDWIVSPPHPDSYIEALIPSAQNVTEIGDRVSQFSSVAQLCLTLSDPMAAARQASLSITNSQSLLKLTSIQSVMPSNHLILCCPLSSCLQSFPASGSFPVSQFFASGGQNIGVSASASVLPMNIQDWFPLEWTCWISLQSKELSRVFSNTTVQKHQFFSSQLSL